MLVENFKPGGLAHHALDHESLAALAPGLVYCSITGFGQTGPRADQPGYDFLVQAMGGIMSLTGEPEGRPMKTGVAVADVVCGLYAAVAILAALRHRDRTGEGQHIDLALFDTQLAWLVNAGTALLATGRAPARHGNAHPSIVPYQSFETADGEIAIAVGNDAQFERLCQAMDRASWATDPGFATNAARVAHRETLIPLLDARFRRETSAHWERALRAANVPAGPVRDVQAAFADPQTAAREMRVSIPHPSARGGAVELIGNPIRLSSTPVTLRRRPPDLGQHTDEVLRELCDATDAQLALWRERGAIR